MNNGLVNTTAQVEKPDDRRIYGTVTAQVIDNCDQTMLGRVQVHFTWLPGYEPWARVAAPMAGPDAGAFFMPQPGDEVLVVFNHGDVREPYVVGSVWNGRDRPPRQVSGDPKHKRMIRTPQGHQVEFDDAAGTIVIKSAQGQQVTLGRDRVEVTLDGQKTTAVTLESGGHLTLKATSTITLDAPTINITAGNNVTLGGRQSARIDGGGYCSVNAAQIHIG